jgi:DNA uptake protein ComE-like DNA-binding protein
MRNKYFLTPLFLLLAATLSTGQKALGQKSKDEGWSELLPPGDGRDLVLESCNSCHNLKVVVHARKSRAEWAKSVNDMIQRGAQIFPEEIDPITAYLTKAFGTEVPKLVNANSASREDLEKLPNLKPELAARIVEMRAKAGPFKNAEELRRALGMEEADFKKIRYLLEYAN